MFDLTFFGLNPKNSLCFSRSLKKWTAGCAVLAQKHGRDIKGANIAFFMRFNLASFGIHASFRALALLSAAFFSSAFDWTRGFHWLVSFRCFSTASSVHFSSCDSFISACRSSSLSRLRSARLFSSVAREEFISRRY